MRCAIAVLTLCLLAAACTGTPPKPPLPEGEYRPINLRAAPAHREVFDFVYEGDILGALPALKAVAPQIQVMPTLGQAIPLPVKLDLRGARLEDALRAIGMEGRGLADVVWNTTRRPGGHHVYIVFLEPEQKGIQQ
ncbi:MAG: hypothetical protein LBU43_08215 [Candidatus Accumulibacter sp.]|nr:hypothetical protein [Accumulibacter sp.]